MENPEERGHASTGRKHGVGVVYWIFAAVGVAFLVIEHREHLYQYLPYALLIACPLLHLFAHGGHGGHHASRRGGDDPREPSA